MEDSVFIIVNRIEMRNNSDIIITKAEKGNVAVFTEVVSRWQNKNPSNIGYQETYPFHLSSHVCGQETQDTQSVTTR